MSRIKRVSTAAGRFYVNLCASILAILASLGLIATIYSWIVEGRDDVSVWMMLGVVAVYVGVIFVAMFASKWATRKPTDDPTRPGA